MAIVDRQTCADRAQMFLNRYKSMGASREPYDRANCELSLISARVWQEAESDEVAARANQSALFQHGAPLPPGSPGSRHAFDPMKYAIILMPRWKEYCSGYLRESLDSETAMANGLVKKDGPNADSSAPPRFVPLESSLREHVDPTAVNAILTDLYIEMRIPEGERVYPDSGARAAPSDALPPGLHRATSSEIEELRAARSQSSSGPKPWRDQVGRLVHASERFFDPDAQPDQSPAPASQPIPAAAATQSVSPATTRTTRTSARAQ